MEFYSGSFILVLMGNAPVCGRRDDIGGVR
jgi:hypothetical protein